jgi:hypothetical protein
MPNDLLRSYRQLRAISTRHHSAALKLLGRSSILSTPGHLPSRRTVLPRARMPCVVAVADVGGEELDEAAAGAFALGADNGRQYVQAGRTSAGGGTISSVSRIGFQSAARGMHGTG